MKLILLVLLTVLVAGCANSRYNQRMAEIEGAYAMKQISTAEYLSLKNGVDQSRKIDFIAARTAQGVNVKR